MQEIPNLITELQTENRALKKELARLKSAEISYGKTKTALHNLEETNRLLGDATPLGIFTVDLKGQIIGINRKMAEICPAMASGGSAPLNLFESPLFGVSDMVEDIRTCMTRQKSLRVEHPLSVPETGKTLSLRFHLSPISAGAEFGGGVIAFVEDVTELKKAEEDLRNSERRYRRLFQSAPIAMVEWDVSRLKVYLESLRKSGIIDFSKYLDQHPEDIPHCWSLIHTADYNQSFLQLMGLTEAIHPSASFLPIDTKDILAVAREVILLAAEGKTSVEKEATIITTSGERKVILGKSLAMSGHEETLARVAIALLDISERKKAESELRESERRFREQAFKDGLTGLYNQRYLYISLAEWIKWSEAEKASLSLIFTDLDQFKHVVDAYGHLNGSRAIRQVAQVIDSCLQDPAYAIAYAGDEFVIVLPRTDSVNAMKKAHEIHSRINETLYTLDQGIQIHLRASFGVATFPDHATDLKELIAAADQALFKVKARGKNMIALYGTESEKE